MELVAVRAEDRELLWNIIRKYLHEMTDYYDDLPDEHGNLHYSYFDAYFTDPERMAFFLYEEKTLVGFAMIHPYSRDRRQAGLCACRVFGFPHVPQKASGPKSNLNDL